MWNARAARTAPPSTPISITARVSGLSRELRDKLAAARPMTVGQAQRLEGMTPAAITLLLAHARRPAEPVPLAS